MVNQHPNNVDSIEVDSKQDIELEKFVDFNWNQHSKDDAKQDNSG